MKACEYFNWAELISSSRSVKSKDMNYDKSEFDSASELFGGDEAKLEAVYNKLVDLKEFTDPSKYKSYAELKKHLYNVIGEEQVADTFQQETVEELSKTRENVLESLDTPTPKAVETAPVTDTNDDGGEDEDTLSYFAKLAQS